MNAQREDIPVAIDATREDLASLFGTKQEPFVLSNGRTVYVRSLTVEERARMMNLEGGLDALTIMIACGVVNAKGEPLFGVYKDAVPFISKLALEPEMIELGKQIARLSGIEEPEQEQTEGN